MRYVVRVSIILLYSFSISYFLEIRVITNESVKFYEAIIVLLFVQSMSRSHNCQDIATVQWWRLAFVFWYSFSSKGPEPSLSRIHISMSTYHQVWVDNFWLKKKNCKALLAHWEERICANTQCLLCSVRCPCIIYGPLVTTIWRRAGCRGIFGEAGMDTGAYLGGNHGFRVWKSQKCEKIVFSKQSNKLGQIFVQLDTKTQTLW